MKLTVTDSANNVIQEKAVNNPIILLSYDDGVGPYSPHGLEALQIAFKIVLISKDMQKKDYDLPIESNIGTIYAKGYSKRFLGSNLKIDFNANYHLLTLSDDGETIEDNLQIEDYR
ncbi:iron-sulfur cluster biosynthesis family protein [Paucilactobacillus suebicus]|uniref:Core domain-containing protein n=1 Tax=Paucilactobacillus suebicus DSM 5007 = KCTC 3549 TaxID=1423807 RepID=A0A0R1VX74_9LACO|nr:iron-sulfur cluster biosynthesis family protein [Paucilactobacillus suebicus]KRM10167.1 hypothetical protein FD16_GL001435 [Paucilactobacillus suebicus DSM 5007 = KCTC 3549]